VVVEGCRVSLMSSWSLSDRECLMTVTGPTPVDAPFRANELGHQLLNDLPAGASSPARFSFDVPHQMLVWSFELDAPMLGRLARIGAGLEVCINDDAADFDRFLVDKFEVGVEVWTDDRDPHELTARLGIEPITLLRAGEPLTSRRGRVARRSVWRLDIERAPPTDFERLARELCERFPAGAAEKWRDDDARLRFSFMVGRLTGGFRIRAGVLERLAALRVPLACYFYNYEA
jgi:Domain of unknown function (DUF4279)